MSKWFGSHAHLGLTRRLDELEKRVAKLESESSIPEYTLPAARLWADPARVPLRDAVSRILDHLGLVIVRDPPKDAVIRLTESPRKKFTIGGEEDGTE